MPARRFGYRGTWSDGRPPHRGCATEGDYTEGLQCNAEHNGWVCTRPPGHVGDHVGHYNDRRVCARWAPAPRRIP